MIATDGVWELGALALVIVFWEHRNHHCRISDPLIHPCAETRTNCHKQALPGDL